MDRQSVEDDIRAKALELGYAKCGIIPVAALAGYTEKMAERMAAYPGDRPFLERLSDLGRPQEAHPWAKSVVVLAKPFGKYRLPESVRGLFASIYLTNVSHVPGTADHERSARFGDYLASLGIRAETDRLRGSVPLRWAASEAGLGLIRRNNFFYTADGSWVYLSAWLIDKDLELREESPLKACPPGCRKCQEACPTKALSGAYSLCATACLAFTTGFGGNDLRDHPSASALGTRIYGCDACQAACPFNKVPGLETVDYPGLDEFARLVSLPSIVEMDYGAIRKLFSKQFWYIGPDRLWKWKINALNAMHNSYRPEYRSVIEKALQDPEEPVRAMAAWVLGKLTE